MPKSSLELERRQLPRCRMLVLMAMFLPAAASAQALPPDVLSFVDRRAQCIYWADEDAYDAPRAAAIADAMSELGCEELEAQEDLLRIHYKDHPAVIDELDGGAGN